MRQKLPELVVLCALVFIVAIAFPPLAAAQFRPGGAGGPGMGGGMGGPVGGGVGGRMGGGNRNFGQPTSPRNYPPDMPGSYSGNNDPFSPRNNQYGSDPVRRANPASPPATPNFRGGIQRDPVSGLPQPGASPFSEDFGPGHGGLRNPFYRGPQAGRSGGMGAPLSLPIDGGPSGAGGSRWQEAQQLLASGQAQSAQQIIDQELQRNRSLGGLMHAAGTLQRAGVDPTAYRQYRNDALQLARQQIDTGASDPLPYVAVAQYSLEDQDDDAFRQAASGLAERFPDDKYSHYFQGIAAARDSDWRNAEASLRRAQELGIPEENISQWLKLAIDNQRWVWQYAWIVLWVSVAWLCGLALLYAVGKLLCWLTLRGLAPSTLGEPSRGQRLLRGVYRWVVLAAGLVAAHAGGDLDCRPACGLLCAAQRPVREPRADSRRAHRRSGVRADGAQWDLGLLRAARSPPARPPNSAE